jgi:hypothetical protein
MIRLKGNDATVALMTPPKTINMDFTSIKLPISPSKRMLITTQAKPAPIPNNVVISTVISPMLYRHPNCQLNL